MKNINKKTKLNLILFGPPGVGKSTSGKLCAEEFGLDFCEGDDELTGKERGMMASGEWGDKQRCNYLERLAKTIRNRHKTSEIGLVTAVALTKQWMRDFLNVETGDCLKFVLVKTDLNMEQLEILVEKRHEAGHPITVNSFRKFTAAFEIPTMPYTILENPHREEKRQELINNLAQVIEKLSK